MAVSQSGLRLGDHRRWRRVKLAVPVQFSIGTPQNAGVSSCLEGCSTDLSMDGVYLTTRAVRSVVPGDPLTVSIGIPLEQRRSFPFSRIAGVCRVVRVDDLRAPRALAADSGVAFRQEDRVGRSGGRRQEGARQPAMKAAQGLALVFCEGITRLGAIVTS